NEEIKAYNKKYENIINLEDYKTEKEYKHYLNNVRKKYHVEENKIKATNLLVERVKGYVDYGIAKNLYNDFYDNRNKWLLKLERDQSKVTAKKNLFSKLLKEYDNNPNYVEKFGYSIENFKQEMRNDLLDLKKEQGKIDDEKEKFNELKEATRVSLDYQKDLTNIEFKAVYPKQDNQLSIDEKYYALYLLKEHEILLPEDKIKEYFKQNDEHIINNYVPVWKQAKDAIISIEIYNKSINKFNSMNINHMNPNKLKSELIKVSSMKELKASYEEYIKEIEPILNHDIHEKISNEINCDKLNPIVKVTLLEEYSKLSNDEIDNLNTKEFIEDIQLKQEEKMHYANERAENDQEG